MKEIRKLISSFSQIIKRNVLMMKKEILIFNQTKIISRIVLQLNTLHMKKDISFLILYHIIIMKKSIYTGQETNIQLPFGGFYKDVIARRNGTYVEPKFNKKSPQWYKTQKQGQIMICEDADAVTGGSIYSSLTGFKINQFFNFVARYVKDLSNDNELIGFDVPLIKGKTIDNHMQRYTPFSFIGTNRDSINPNKHLDASGTRYYSNKYAMSSTILLYSLFDIPLPKSKEGKMILLWLDQGFKGYYSYYKFGKLHDYRESYINNLDMLGLTELIDVLKAETPSSFDKANKLLVDNGKDTIHVDENGELYTHPDLLKFYNYASKELGYPIELPTGKFTKVQSFNKQFFETKNGDPLKSKNIYSLAYTYRRRGVYSEIID